MTLDRRASVTATTLASAGFVVGGYRVVARLLGAWLLVAIVAVLVVAWTVSLALPALFQGLPAVGVVRS